MFESHYGSFDRPLEIACFYPFRIPRDISIIVNHAYTYARKWDQRKSERSRSLVIIGNLSSQDGNAKEDLD